jgi:hypothetical protein
MGIVDPTPFMEKYAKKETRSAKNVAGEGGALLSPPTKKGAGVARSSSAGGGEEDDPAKKKAMQKQVMNSVEYLIGSVLGRESSRHQAHTKLRKHKTT